MSSEDPHSYMHKQNLGNSDPIEFAGSLYFAFGLLSKPWFCAIYSGSFSGVSLNISYCLWV